jgi:hypothetical protein
VNWWALAMLVVGSIIIVATSIPAALIALWRRQEQRDGLR